MASTATSRFPRALGVGFALLLVITLGACSDDGGSDAGAGDGGAAESRGAKLYQQSCASCHGRDLRGTDKGPSHLSQVYAPDHHPDASFGAAITQGASAHHWNFGDMPPVKGLDDTEIDLIIAYVREEQQAHGFEAYPPN